MMFFPWMADIHRDAHADPFARLQKAFVGFFKKVGQRPKFHKKGRKDSFYVANDKFGIEGFSVRLPVIGEVRLQEQRRYNGKIMGTVVSRHADRWFISVQVEVDNFHKSRTADGVAGVDLGVKTAAVTYNGIVSESFEGPKPLKTKLFKLKRKQRAVSKKQKGSKNRFKATRKVEPGTNP